MTLGKLLLYIGIVALVLTVVIGLLKKGHKSWLMTFLQSFTGVLFMFSGWVKAVDPMGTAFKMEQYFTEFESTLQGTWFNFMAPLFPWLSHHAIWFSVFMIILEIVVGIMLVMGHKTKLTSWIFLLVLVFFTILTGFTYLTGYVPAGENFFSFSQWGVYDANNMRVTDCGCFGDFIKLEPKTSFLKDVVLLIPAFFFVFRHKRMHQLFTARIRSVIVVVAIIGLLLYCLRNFVWNEPQFDFRPFKVGVNIAEKKAAEEEAEASRRILTWKLKNKADGRIVEISDAVYMKELDSYPKDEWTVLGNTMSELAVPHSKISDFQIIDLDGTDVTADILENPDPILFVVAYKLKGETSFVQEPVRDSIYQTDTIQIGDSVMVVRRLANVAERMETKAHYTWDKDYLARWTELLKPLSEAAAKEGIATYAVAGGAAEDAISSFKEAIGADFPVYEADDIVLKTIARSNPGLLLMKNGIVLGKWHYRHFPDAATLRQLATQ